ncbi:MAG TPA: (2Fe-2S)-binding protein [Enhygromyxa sp.]|nr:(2Fe-2S)-binding protein [Enhygromyxa sp.]
MAEHSSKGLTRRGLFRSIGTATLVAGCVKQDPPTDTPDQSPAPGLEGAFGLTPAPLEFVLDGQPVKREVEARTTLLELLRIDLDKTGAKLVCDRGSCGACMVLVDGVPRNSCMLLAHDVAGAQVTTVAGLGPADQLSPLQLAFVEHDALQCGFCTSGMLISSTALLEQQKAGGQQLTREQVADALAGNLCRCGTYPHVIDAVLSVAHGEPARRSELIRVRKEGA